MLLVWSLGCFQGVTEGVHRAMKTLQKDLNIWVNPEDRTDQDRKKNAIKQMLGNRKIIQQVQERRAGRDMWKADMTSRG